jgi:fumarate hydratase class II
MFDSKRIEKDSFGDIEVPAKALYGAQTQRSLIHFRIGKDIMPEGLIESYLILKKAAAVVNERLGVLPKDKMELIIRACDSLLADLSMENFPLKIWQTGSGTQTNMNVNEVIANKAISIVNGVLGSKNPIHPNDHVNMSQSSNDSFPSAMHIAVAQQVHKKLLPSLDILKSALKKKAKAFHDILKIGRTHLQDAVPITLGQEFSGYASLIERNCERIHMGLKGIYELAIGGTAVGTGLNAPEGFAANVCDEISRMTKLPFTSHPNKFAALSCHDELVFLSGALRTLACALMKIANDIRLLGSGPRCGLHELLLPENEPGSSIMPGKVNPTQAEAMTMVAAHVIGSDQAVALAGSQGHFELNVFKPVILYNVMHSIDLLSDTCEMFSKYCIEGIEANTQRLNQYLEESLMLVTALSPHIGYDKSAKIAHFAYEHNLNLKQAGVRLGFLSEEQFDMWVKPEKMV